MFKTVQEAFNFYRNFSLAEIEKRAQEVKGMITTNPDVDIESINIELEGLSQAKENAQDQEARSGLKLKVVGGEAAAAEKRSFNAENVIDSVEYRSAFYKTLLGQQLNENEKAAFTEAAKIAEKRSDEFNSSSNSLAILPTSTLNEVVSKARTMGGIIGECRAFNMPTKIAIPVGSPSDKAAWHTEGATVETEKKTLTSVTFDGNEIIKIFSISAKVRKMSIDAFEAYLVDELTACVMETIADSLVNGDGTTAGEGKGLASITWTKNTNAVEIASTDELTFKDITKAVGLLKRGYGKGAKWAMNNATLYNSIYGLTDDNARPIFVVDPKAEEVGKILGFEVVIDDNIENDVIFFGNFKYMGYNLPEGVAIEASTQSSFKKGLIDYRALAIADSKPIIDEAFVKIYKATPTV